MTNAVVVAHVIASRLGSTTPPFVELDEVIDVIAAVMVAFGFDPDAEFEPPEMAS